jgi:hypothetical protein
MVIVMPAITSDTTMVPKLMRVRKADGIEKMLIILAEKIATTASCSMMIPSCSKIHLPQWKGDAIYVVPHAVPAGCQTHLMRVWQGLNAKAHVKKRTVIAKEVERATKLSDTVAYGIT